MKVTVLIFSILLLAIPVYASWIESLNCDDLFSDVFTPQTEFSESSSGKASQLSVQPSPSPSEASGSGPGLNTV